MSLVTPTVADINANIIAQIEATINQTIPLVPKAFNRVLAKVLAAVFVLLWKYAGFIFLQIFVSTATIEDVNINGVLVSPLKEWGRLIGAGDPVGAVQARLVVDITVITQVGSLPSGTAFVNSATGVTYVLLSSVLLDAATVQGTIQAAGDQGGGNGSGTIGNAADGDIISFVNSIAEVNRETVVASTAVEGSDGESTAAYRQRIIDLFQKQPQGGALVDYEIWGESTPDVDVINVYPYTSTTPGQVDIFAEVGDQTDGIPSPEQIALILDAINFDPDTGLATRRPANAVAVVFGITRTGFDVNVIGIEDTTADIIIVQNQITTTIEEFMIAREPFISGVTTPPRADSITNSALIGLVEDIVTAAGGFFTTVTFKLNGGINNQFTYILGQGEKAKAVDITFSAS